MAVRSNRCGIKQLVQCNIYHRRISILINACILTNNCVRSGTHQTQHIPAWDGFLRNSGTGSSVCPLALLKQTWPDYTVELWPWTQQRVNIELDRWKTRCQLIKETIDLTNVSAKRISQRNDVYEVMFDRFGGELIISVLTQTCASFPMFCTNNLQQYIHGLICDDTRWDGSPMLTIIFLIKTSQIKPGDRKTQRRELNPSTLPRQIEQLSFVDHIMSCLFGVQQDNFEMTSGMQPRKLRSECDLRSTTSSGPAGSAPSTAGTFSKSSVDDIGNALGPPPMHQQQQHQHHHHQQQQQQPSFQQAPMNQQTSASSKFPTPLPPQQLPLHPVKHEETKSKPPGPPHPTVTCKRPTRLIDTPESSSPSSSSSSSSATGSFTSTLAGVRSPWWTDTSGSREENSLSAQTPLCRQVWIACRVERSLVSKFIGVLRGTVELILHKIIVHRTPNGAGREWCLPRCLSRRPAMHAVPILVSMSSGHGGSILRWSALTPEQSTAHNTNLNYLIPLKYLSQCLTTATVLHACDGLRMWMHVHACDGAWMWMHVHACDGLWMWMHVHACDGAWMWMHVHACEWLWMWMHVHACDGSWMWMHVHACDQMNGISRDADQQISQPRSRMNLECRSSPWTLCTVLSFFCQTTRKLCAVNWRETCLVPNVRGLFVDCLWNARLSWRLAMAYDMPWKSILTMILPYMT